uniref:Uncharacterized protein n=1 Tax=Arundo donax TaxID=35708 RepID=A0A0A9B3F0_ARUDO
MVTEIDQAPCRPSFLQHHMIYFVHVSLTKKPRWLCNISEAPN